MKTAYESILVAHEKLAGLDAALAKAATLERYSGAELTLLEVIYDELEKEPDNVLSRTEKDQLLKAYVAAERHALADIAGGYKEQVASLNTAVSWSENREIGICRYALQHHVDLIIKPQDSMRSPLGALRQTSVHRLLAQAACPVLISKVPNWDDNAAIVACVNVADDNHRVLNESIVQHAMSLAELLDVPLHLLNVTPLPQVSLGRFSASLDPIVMQKRMFAHRETELQRLQSMLKGSASQVFYHIKSGILVEEIKSLAETVGADIVVMGTASREGLRRFLIGNSAEVVLNRLDADMLCVKENWLEHTDYGD